MQRKASAVWQGGLKDGKGMISTDSGVLKQTQYSFSTRFENGVGTNPEELLAAAHAGCFTMALSAQLGNAGMTASKLETTATITLDKLPDGFGIIRCRWGDLSDRAVGRLRGHHSPAPRNAKVPLGAPVLPLHLENVEIYNRTHPFAQSPRSLAGFLWPALTPRSRRGLGRWPRAGLRPHAIWRGVRSGDDGRSAGFPDGYLSERYDLFYPRPGRRHSAFRLVPRAGRHRSWFWFRISCRRHWLFAFHLRLVLQAGGEYLPARFSRRHAAHGRRTASPPQLPPRPGGPPRSPQRLGTLVRRVDGEPSFLSRARLFSLAARQPILDRLAHGDSRHVRTRHRRR